MFLNWNLENHIHARICEWGVGKVSANSQTKATRIIQQKSPVFSVG